MMREPVTGEARHRFKRARFFEKVGGSGNDFQFYFAAHLGHRIPIHTDDDLIRTADDQEGWRFHIRQRPARKVGSAPARDHRANCLSPSRSRD